MDSVVPLPDPYRNVRNAIVLGSAGYVITRTALNAFITAYDASQRALQNAQDGNQQVWKRSRDTILQRAFAKLTKYPTVAGGATAGVCGVIGLMDKSAYMDTLLNNLLQLAASQAFLTSASITAIVTFYYSVVRVNEIQRVMAIYEVTPPEFGELQQSIANVASNASNLLNGPGGVDFVELVRQLRHITLRIDELIEDLRAQHRAAMQQKNTASFIMTFSGALAAMFAISGLHALMFAKSSSAWVAPSIVSVASAASTRQAFLLSKECDSLMDKLGDREKELDRLSFDAASIFERIAFGIPKPNLLLQQLADTSADETSDGDVADLSAGENSVDNDAHAHAQ